MSKIDEQIKALQLKKKKIDYVSYIADLLKGDKHCVDYNEVKDEILAKVEPLLLELMTSIENDVPMKKQESKEALSESELGVLKLLANKALSRTQDGTNPTPSPEKPKVTPEHEVSTNDKMAFAMNNRHLANKKVNVINDKNVPLTGMVVGLDAPHVHVKTDSGPTIRVPLEKVVLA